jgi:hypothetical protein
MVLRETTFVIGGTLTVGLGLALAAGLLLSHAGLDYNDSWLSVGIAVGLGVFFIYVGQTETANVATSPVSLSQGSTLPALDIETGRRGMPTISKRETGATQDGYVSSNPVVPL